MKTNALFYGDNLVWLRDHKYFPDESVDLIYLDPPFNSKADYNVLFNEPGKGGKSQAQIQAFDDTWDWSSEASEIALNELAKKRPSIAEFISWLSRQGKAQESMAAYLSMMAVRLVELHRVLKSSGSLYLHCDPTASHYMKLVLDAIWGTRISRMRLFGAIELEELVLEDSLGSMTPYFSTLKLINGSSIRKRKNRSRATNMAMNPKV